MVELRPGHLDREGVAVPDARDKPAHDKMAS
jgi:hypothetical protein